MYRGLPKEFLLDLVEEEIKGLLIDIKNYAVGRKRAYKLVRQNMKRSNHSDRLNGEINLNENEDCFDDFDDGFNILDLTTAPVEIRRIKTESSSLSNLNPTGTNRSTPNMNRACCIAEELQTFLYTGQKLDEPRCVRT